MHMTKSLIYQKILPAGYGNVIDKAAGSLALQRWHKNILLLKSHKTQFNGRVFKKLVLLVSTLKNQSNDFYLFYDII